MQWGFRAVFSYSQHFWQSMALSKTSFEYWEGDDLGRWKKSCEDLNRLNPACCSIIWRLCSALQWRAAYNRMPKEIRRTNWESSIEASWCFQQANKRSKVKGIPKTDEELRQ